ncbi:MAG: copper-binding protein [Rhodocyclales bacterium]|nr:copper-binding protein [Rhodocyclales bacterium]
MKHITKLALSVALTLGAGGALAQQKMEDMKGMPMGGDKAMPMKDIPMGATQGQVHHANGTVKKVDAVNGMVTLAHGPVASLEWPAMTMGFKVKDKALLDKLAVGAQVAFDFVKEGAGYVVTAVR